MTTNSRTKCAQPSFRKLSFATALAAALPCAPAFADDPFAVPAGLSVSGGHHGAVRADGHAPIGVMGDHMHKAGEWMLSYRYMHMDMQGSRIGTNGVSTSQILEVPNRFANPPMQPPSLRIVPTEMSMDMHMFGGMYAPTNNLTLMAMVNYIDKDMQHLTFAGMVPQDPPQIGSFTTKSSGIGDTKIGGLYRLYDDGTNHLHLNLGLSIPTGSTTERGRIFAPNNSYMNVRLPYAMQLGTGTYDLLPGVTYTGRSGDFTWGSQFRSEIRLEDENDEGYAYGDLYGITGWVAYEWADWISTSVRLDAWTQDSISGIDPNIAGPVQTANPDFYGGEQAFAYFGANLAGQTGALRGHRLAFEVGVPIYRNLNGPQMETDWTFMAGWQKAF